MLWVTIATAIPRAAPANTSKGECPTSSFNRSPVTSSFSRPKFSTSLFNRAACSPVARRTPEASYITTNENTTQTANKDDDKPSFNATAAVKAVTNEVWELGMPPEPTRRSKLILLPSINTSKNLRTWARNQPMIAAIKISFARSSFNHTFFTTLNFICHGLTKILKD